MHKRHTARVMQQATQRAMHIYRVRCKMMELYIGVSRLANCEKPQILLRKFIKEITINCTVQL